MAKLLPRVNDWSPGAFVFPVRSDETRLVSIVGKQEGNAFVLNDPGLYFFFEFVLCLLKWHVSLLTFDNK